MFIMIYTFINYLKILLQDFQINYLSNGFNFGFNLNIQYVLNFLCLFFIK